MLFGYDTGVTSGAELFLKNDFALSTFALEVIVSGVLAGVASGAILGGLLISEIYPLKIRSSSEGLAAAFNGG